MFLNSFAYIDVPVTSVLKKAIDRGIVNCTQSFDVVCRFGINYIVRISTGEYRLISPEQLAKAKITFAVPDMHIRGHDPACADVYGLKFMEFVGRFHGEGVESMWALLNWLQEIVRASGFGARRDLLTDHFLHWNEQKFRKMCEFSILFKPTNLMLESNLSLQLCLKHSPSHF